MGGISLLSHGKLHIGGTIQVYHNNPDPATVTLLINKVSKFFPVPLRDVECTVVHTHK